MGSERHDNMCKLWGYLLAFMEVGARRYGAEFLPGGAFSEENLAAYPEMKFILQTVSANAMLVESGFGAIDKSISTTTQTMSLDNASTRALCSKNNWHACRKTKSTEAFRKGIPEMMKKGRAFQREAKPREGAAKKLQVENVLTTMQITAVKNEAHQTKASNLEGVPRWTTMACAQEAYQKAGAKFEGAQFKLVAAQQRIRWVLCRDWSKSPESVLLSKQKSTDGSKKKTAAASAQDLLKLVQMMSDAKASSMMAAEATAKRAEKASGARAGANAHRPVPKRLHPADCV